MPAPVPAIATAGTEVPGEPERTVSRNLQAIPADEFDRIEWRDPVYPQQALRDHTRGRVELEFTITTDGRVRDIVILDSQPTGTFDRAAADALGQWRFRPRLVNGQAVPQRSSLTLRFDVDD